MNLWILTLHPNISINNLLSDLYCPFLNFTLGSNRGFDIASVKIYSNKGKFQAQDNSEDILIISVSFKSIFLRTSLTRASNLFLKERVFKTILVSIISMLVFIWIGTFKMQVQIQVGSILQASIFGQHTIMAHQSRNIEQ